MPGVQIDRSLFQTPLQIIGGQVIQGQVTAPETDLGTQRFTLGRRALILPYGQRVAAGTYLMTQRGQVYLVGAGADNEAARLNYSVSHLFPMTAQVNVQRVTMTVHPVTGQKIQGGLTTVATGLWCAFEDMLEAKDTMSVPSKQYRIVTGFPIQENDRLSNGMSVKLSQLFMGVYVGVVS